MRSSGHPLAGRDAELGLLGEFVTYLEHDGAALLVTGPAGIGKTSMALAAAELAIQGGFLVHTITPSEFDPPDRFTSLTRLLLPLRGAITGLPAHVQTSLLVAMGSQDGPPVRREFLGAATLALVKHAAANRPLLLIIDDAHWLDAASAEVIAFVARRLRGSRVGVLATVRTDTRGPLLVAGLPGHELSPLNREDAESLLTARFPQLTQKVRSRIVTEADGLPLALLEMPMALTSAQRTGDVPLPARLPVGERLKKVFGGRVAHLPPLTRRELLLAALGGAAGDLAIIRAASPQDPQLLGLAVAEISGLVRVTDLPARVEFVHPLARATVVDRASPEERRAAHLALASAHPTDSAARAWHLSDAAGEPDEAVAALLERHALKTLALGDVAGTMAALQRAAELSPDRAERARRQVQAAFVGADVTGDLQRAAELLADAAQLEPALSDSLPASISASYILLNGECELDTAHKLLVTAIENHPGRSDPTDQQMNDALHSLLMMSWFGGRPTLWEPFERAVARLGNDLPADLDLCYRTFGDPVRLARHAIPTLDRMLGELTAELDPIRVTRLSLAGVYTDRLGRCREALWRVINDGRQGGAVALAINALVSSCVDDWLTGQWDEALALAAEGGMFSDTYGYRRYSVILVGYIDQLIRICRGELKGGLVAAEEMTQWAADRGAETCTMFALHLRTLHAIAREDYESAYGHVTSICAPGELAPYAPHQLWMLFDLAEAAVKTGRLSAARAHVAALRAAELDRISPRLAMVVQGCAALVTEDDDEAERLFTAALSDHSAIRWPFDRARIELSFGECLRQQHRLAQASHHLHVARSGFEQLGARPWVDRTDRELRLTGEASPTARRGGDLTPQEHQVAELAASGLTNRQIGERLFLSHRSVGAILYRVFPKLGVTSRAALRGALSAGAEPRPRTDDSV